MAALKCHNSHRGGAEPNPDEQEAEVKVQNQRQWKQTSPARLRFTSAELCAVFVAFLLAGAFLMTLSEN